MSTFQKSRSTPNSVLGGVESSSSSRSRSRLMPELSAASARMELRMLMSESPEAERSCDWSVFDSLSLAVESSMSESSVVAE